MVHLAARNEIIVIQGYFHRNEASVKQDLSELNAETVSESARQRALISWHCTFYPTQFRWAPAFDSVKMTVFIYLLAITPNLFLC